LADLFTGYHRTGRQANALEKKSSLLIESQGGILPAVAHEKRTISAWERNLPILGAAGFGLYTGRVLVEFGLLAWAWPFSALLGLGLAAAGAGLSRLIPRPPAAWLGVCYLYVLYPQVDTQWAAATGFLALAAATSSLDLSGLKAGLKRLMFGLTAELATGLGSFAVYVWTLAPTLLPADSGEFQLVTRTLGIAHPPGYPLYTLLGWLFTLLPVGDAAYRVNLMSAIFAALTLTLVMRVTRYVTGSAPAGLIAALSLGAAPTFWAQATTANIRSLVALLTMALLATLLWYERSCTTGESSPRSGLALPLAAFLFGLGVTHHGSLVFLALPAGLFLLANGPRRLANARLISRAVAAAGASLLVLAYLPVRGAMNAPLNPGGLTTVDGFLRHVLARGFEGDMFYFASPAMLPNRLRLLAQILRLEFGWPLLGISLAAVFMLTWRQLRTSLLLTGTFLVIAFVAITYRAPQTVEYLMPAYVALALSLGIGVGLVLPARRLQFAKPLLLATFLFFPVQNAWTYLPSFRELSMDRATRQYGEALLRSAPPGATVLANWHYATPLWYLQRVEGQRPDVRVSYVAPHEAEPIGKTWRSRTDEALAVSPTIVTNRVNELAGAAYQLEPLAGAYRVVLPGQDVPPGDAQRLDVLFGDRLRLVGYRVDQTGLPSGEIARVSLYWQPHVVEQDYAVFVHLLDQTGTIWGQADRSHTRFEWNARTLLAEYLSIFRLPYAPPGRYTLVAGVYYKSGDRLVRLPVSAGGDNIRLADITVNPLTERPVTQRPMAQAFRDGPTITGVDYDTGLPDRLRVYLHWHNASGESVSFLADGHLVAQGELPRALYATTAFDLPATSSNLELELSNKQALGPWRFPVGARFTLPTPVPGERFVNLGGEMALIGDYNSVDSTSQALDLEFLALRPLTRDYTVSVQVEGTNWRTQDDSTPAQGTIPTLKWVKGMKIWDSHRVRLPNGATGPARITLTVYDAFTLAPLPVLDDGLAKLGQGTTVVLRETEWSSGD